MEVGTEWKNLSLGETLKCITEHRIAGVQSKSAMSGAGILDIQKNYFFHERYLIVNTTFVK